MTKLYRSAKSQRLPKQWLHWAKLAGLKPEGSSKRYRHISHPYLRGKNRNWRVNMHGVFECSCPLEHFDRWANSRGAEQHSIPETKAQFLIAVERLIEESKDAR